MAENVTLLGRANNVQIAKQPDGGERRTRTITVIRPQRISRRSACDRLIFYAVLVGVVTVSVTAIIVMLVYFD